MPDETDKNEPGEDPVLTKAKKRFKLALEAWSNQAQREKDDLAFQVPEKQWEEGARRQRLGMAVEGVPTPARPVLSISKLDQPIQMVLNQERSAHLGVSIEPLSADADKETAEILEGLYRRIERDSQAHIGRSWGFNRAVKAGRGYYEVCVEYDEYSDNPTDQVIRIKRILHQESVYFDPAAQEADFSDANYAFVASWVPVADFEAEFPKATIPPDDEFADNDAQDPQWVKGDGESRAVRVLRYYYKDKTYKQQEKDTRKRETCKITWCVLTGSEVLDSGPWAGKWIPIVPVIGSELVPFDGQRYWQGIIGPAKDAQRLYNYSASTAVELVALEPKAPFLGTKDQFEGYEDEWQQANVRNFPFMRYNAVTVGGSVLPPPERMQVDVGRLGPSMQLLQQADQFIQVTTATYDPSLGRTSGTERSGKAIQALQQQGDTGNSHFMHNLAEISMAYESKVILDLIPAIYDRPERLIRTLDEEGDSKTVMLNARHVTNPQTKMPVPLGADGQPPPGMMAPPPQGQPPGPPGPPGAPPMPQPPPMTPQPPQVKHFDLRRGIYSVAVSIGKTRQSALQEGAEEIGQILQAQPNLGPIVLPTYLGFRTFPGAEKIADDLRKVRDRQFPFLAGDDNGAPTVDQVQAQLAAQSQQMQQMGQQLQLAMQKLETEQAKQQASIQNAQLKSQTDLQIAEANNQTKLALETIIAKFEAMTKGTQLTHEAVQNEADRQHEAAMSVANQAAAATNKAADLSFKAADTVPLQVPVGGSEMAPGGGA